VGVRIFAKKQESSLLDIFSVTCREGTRLKCGDGVRIGCLTEDSLDELANKTEQNSLRVQSNRRNS
jgi:hypothetical protein